MPLKGAGYILKLTVDRDNESSHEILQTVQKHMPNSYEMKSESSGDNAVEVSLSIPCDETTGPKLAPMFKDLDETKGQLGIQTIGLSLSTMEDVFLAYVLHS